MSGILTLNDDTYSTTINDSASLAELISKNIEHYLQNRTSFEIDDKVRLQILSSDISTEQKLEVLSDIHHDESCDLAKLFKLAAQVIFDSGSDCNGIAHEDYLHAIKYATTSEVSMTLILRRIQTWNIDEFRTAIKLLPQPYSDIGKHGKRPKIVSNDTNTEVLRLAQKLEFVSSIKEETDTIRVNTWKS